VLLYGTVRSRQVTRKPPPPAVSGS
jgi:hypothetical protein